MSAPGTTLNAREEAAAQAPEAHAACARALRAAEAQFTAASLRKAAMEKLRELQRRRADAAVLARAAEQRVARDAAAQPDEPSVAVRYPALERWRAELAAGQRTATTFDVLWRAACFEASAAELEVDGMPAVAARCRREAEAIIRAAARGRSG